MYGHIGPQLTEVSVCRRTLDLDLDVDVGRGLPWELEVPTKADLGFDSSTPYGMCISTWAEVFASESFGDWE
jgi:hypothetical protein